MINFSRSETIFTFNKVMDRHEFCLSQGVIDDLRFSSTKLSMPNFDRTKSRPNFYWYQRRYYYVLNEIQVLNPGKKSWYLTWLTRNGLNSSANILRRELAA